MITFRARPEDALDWTTITLVGDDEEVLARIIAVAFLERDCETLVSIDADDFEVLEI